MFDEITIPGGREWATRVEGERLLEIANVRGRQVCDLVAFCAQDLDEHLSPAHTRSMLGRLTLRVGDLLWTNARNPIFEIVEDTVGCHDLLMAACDHRRYEMDYGLEDHRSCRSKFAVVLGTYEIGYLRVPDPVNLFQKTTVAEDGSLTIGISPAAAGDKVMLAALTYVIVAFSACLQDQNPINDWVPTDIRVLDRGTK